MYSELKIINVSQQRGFTMLESLLTLFVLTIGVLGVAGLQIQGMRSGGMAMQRTVVLIKTQELFEQMRANKATVLLYNGGGTGTNNGCNSGAVCTPTEQVANDLYFWRSDIDALLPTVTGATLISVTAGATATEPTNVVITVVWQDKTDTLSYSTSARI